ncbi:MAG: glycosyltransferase [Acidobacteriia bacterium]|nr:glycosyltransferase [Terriglobia bacterium]
MECRLEWESVGVGGILWAPMPIWRGDGVFADFPDRMKYIYDVARAYPRGRNAPRAILESLRTLFRNRCCHLRYSTTILSDGLSDLIKEQSVSLLALHWISRESRPLIHRALVLGIPFVFINHFDNARLSLPPTRKCISRAAGLATVSDQGIPADMRNSYVNLSDAVDTDFFRLETVRSSGGPPDCVLLPARIQEGKGHQDLIQAASILARRNVDLTLCFAGSVDSAPLNQDLRLAAGKLGTGRVRLLGEMCAEEMRDWYARSSVVALPSYSEGLPRVVLEAQAMKRPVVAYNGGGTGKALLPDETGFLVEPGDVNGLAEKIGFLLGAESERGRMGERGREFVLREFSIPALIRRHESFYLGALAGCRKAAERL